ncbi:MAG: hypothetical protein Q9170_004328 [Blastenia crenularia]
MGSRDVTIGVHPRAEETVFQPRKRFKTSELPLNATQRSTIDSLLHTIKKKGEFDALRKKVWSQFGQSNTQRNFNDRLTELADAEVERDPSLLSRDRRKAQLLMQGAIDRSDIYKMVEQSLDQLISEHLNHVLAAGRDIRKAEIGEEAAANEVRRGNISDEEYAKDTAARREARERRRKQDETRKRREEEKEQLRAEATKKEAELERLRKADERRRERKAKEEKLDVERRRRIEAEDERRKHFEQRKKEEAENERSLDRPKEEPRSRHRSIEKATAAIKGSFESPYAVKEEDSIAAANVVPQIDEKAIEAAALEELLRESRELAAKSSSKPQVERSESLDPPYRKSHTLKPKSSNISPSKPADLRQSIAYESLKPKLSFSATNLGRDATTQREQPSFQRKRSSSPASARNSYPIHRSRSPSRAHRGDKYSQTRGGSEDKYHYPKSSISHRETAVDYHKDGVRETSSHSHSHSHNREGVKERESSRHYNRDDHFHREDRQKYPYDDGHKREHLSSGYDRSLDRRHQERDYDRDRERHRDHDRGYHREDCDHRHDRSQSPHKPADSKHDSERLKGVRDDSRTKSPMDIDRYTPSGGSHAKETEGEKYKQRDDVSGSRDESHRHRVQEHEPRDDRHSTRNKDRGGREDSRYRDRRDEQDRYRERYSERAGNRSERDEDGNRDRDRDMDKGHDYDRGKERRDDRQGHQRDDYDRSKGRRDEGHDRDRERDRGRGYVEIDRYVPCGRDDPKRARGKE